MSFKNTGELKRLLLMFDRLALDMGSAGMSHLEQRILSDAKKDVDWLSQQQLLTTLAGLVTDSTPTRLTSALPVQGGDLLDLGYRGAAGLTGRIGGMMKVVSGKALRVTASELREKFGVDAIAVPNSLESENIDTPVGQEAVVRITLREFPVLSDSTPWNQIIEFRSDAEARSQFPRLKQWINKTVRTGLKEYEVADELRDLIYEYQLGMKCHKMKVGAGELKMVLATNVDVAESLTRLQMTGANKGLFTVTDYKLSLLEEERRTPGREIAYILSAKAAFER
ncbi:hypothetical protein [Tunturiibacter psychrotolerans]|uniref:hypothetical protein n=1 Tax=Tunturiibacter psychrotolerans TaxID=3069686 RepID=UPI003D1B47A2